MGIGMPISQSNNERILIALWLSVAGTISATTHGSARRCQILFKPGQILECRSDPTIQARVLVGTRRARGIYSDNDSGVGLYAFNASLAYRYSDPNRSPPSALHPPLLTMASERKKRQRKTWNRFADSGRTLLVCAATLLPDRAHANRARASAGACLIAIKLVTVALKQAIPECRPDGEDNKSFPSEHAAECVAAAMIIEREYPGKIGALAYALAATVSLSRIESKKHYPRDVIAGALIGGAAFWLSLQLRVAAQRRMLHRA